VKEREKKMVTAKKKKSLEGRKEGWQRKRLMSFVWMELGS